MIAWVLMASQCFDNKNNLIRSWELDRFRNSNLSVLQVLILFLSNLSALMLIFVIKQTQHSTGHKKNDVRDAKSTIWKDIK
jgi:hypothetical protein